VGFHSYGRKASQLLSERVGEYHGDYEEPWDQTSTTPTLKTRLILGGVYCQDIRRKRN